MNCHFLYFSRCSSERKDSKLLGTTITPVYNTPAALPTQYFRICFTILSLYTSKINYDTLSRINTVCSLGPMPFRPILTAAILNSSRSSDCRFTQSELHLRLAGKLIDPIKPISVSNHIKHRLQYLNRQNPSSHLFIGLKQTSSPIYWANSLQLSHSILLQS